LSMQWNRSNAIGLSRVACLQCGGTGLRTVWKVREAPCSCVLRAVFRACFERYRECAALTRYSSSVSLEFSQGTEGGRTYGRKIEEYLADVCLVAKRTLSEEEHQMFRFHYLLGADWKLCGRRLNLDRGNVFHLAYRVERKLGRAFSNLEPYALYPVADYFAGTVKRAQRTSLTSAALERGWAEKLPLTA
jgi:hypothetical protein